MSEARIDRYKFLRERALEAARGSTGASGSVTVDTATNLYFNETASIVDAIIEKVSPQLREDTATLAIEEIKKSSLKFQEELKASMKDDLDIDRRLTRMEESMQFIKILYPIMFGGMIAVFVAIISNLVK